MFACAGLMVVVLTAFRFRRMSDMRWWPRVHSRLLAFALALFVFLFCARQWHLLSPSAKV